MNKKPFIILILLSIFISSCATSADSDVKVVDALSSKHIGKIVIIQTDTRAIAGIGSLPPDGMITWNEKEKGNVFTGRLDAIEKDLVTISAFAGVPSDPEYRKSAQIEKRRIKKVRIQNTEQ